jgi:pectinesterase
MIGAMIRQVVLVALLFGASSILGVDLPKPDIVVAVDGSGDFKTIQAAVASVAATNRERIVVFVKDGTYHEKIRVDAPFVTLRGQSRKKTRIEFPQTKDDFAAQPDHIGWAVINLNHANDFVLENLTVVNTAKTILAHTFAIAGTGDRTVIVDCDVLSNGADTVSLGRGEPGRSYHARCNFSGSVDFVCPRGWCYAIDCNFYAHTKNAALWHEGRRNPDMKFVLRNCRFDGINRFVLGRGSLRARFYFVDCKFSARMANEPIQRMVYGLNSGLVPTTDTRLLWAERAYFYNCHRATGDFDWFANNLSSAPGSPRPNQITGAWTFDGKWNPENEFGPAIQESRRTGRQIALRFSETVTVKGEPRLRMCNGGMANYISGSGGDTLLFELASDSSEEICSVDLNGGSIIACEASAFLRLASMSLPTPTP